MFFAFYFLTLFNCVNNAQFFRRFIVSCSAPAASVVEMELHGQVALVAA